MFNKLFHEFAKVLWLLGSKASATDTYYPASGSFIDMADAEKVVFHVYCEDVGAPDFQVWQDKSATATGDIKVVTSAAKTDVAAGDDGKWFSIEVAAQNLDINNDFRYVTLAASNTGGTSYCAIMAIPYPCGTQPPTQSALYYAKVAVAG